MNLSQTKVPLLLWVGSFLFPRGGLPVEYAVDSCLKLAIIQFDEPPLPITERQFVQPAVGCCYLIEVYIQKTFRYVRN